MKTLLNLINQAGLEVNETELKNYIVSLGLNPDALVDADARQIAEQLISQNQTAIAPTGPKSVGNGKKGGRKKNAGGEEGLQAVAASVSETRDLTQMILGGMQQEAVTNARAITTAAKQLPNTTLSLVKLMLDEEGGAADAATFLEGFGEVFAHPGFAVPNNGTKTDAA